MDYVRFPIHKVSYASCLRYICSTWFLDIRKSTCCYYVILLFSYFETCGSIPELNDDHSEKKFTIMRKVTDSSTIHKGDNTVSTGHCTTVTVFYREC